MLFYTCPKRLTAAEEEKNSVRFGIFTYLLVGFSFIKPMSV